MRNADDMKGRCESDEKITRKYISVPVRELLRQTDKMLTKDIPNCSLTIKYDFGYSSPLAVILLRITDVVFYCQGTIRYVFVFYMISVRGNLDRCGVIVRFAQSSRFKMASCLDQDFLIL